MVNILATRCKAGLKFYPEFVHFQYCPTYGGGGPGSAPSGYDSRASWPGGPPPSGASQHSQHGPGSPGQPQPSQQSQNQSPSQPQQNSSSSVPVSQPSPQPTQPPISHSPGPGPGGQMPPSPQQHNHQHQAPTGHPQGFPSRPPPPTTPNAHAPDAAVSHYLFFTCYMIHFC